MSEKRFLLQNSSYKLVSELIGRAAIFLLMIVAARRLGTSGFGRYMYGVSLGFVLAQIADMGLQIWMSREVALTARAARPRVQQALWLKGGLALLVISLLLLLTGRETGSYRLSLLLLGATQLLLTFLEFTAYIFRGQQQLWVEAWLLGLGRVVTAVFGLAALSTIGTLFSLAVTSFAGTLLVTGIGFYLLARDGWLAAASPPTAAACYRLLQEAAPLGIAIFLSIAYTRVAIFWLQLQLGETAVAHYSAAARLIEPTQILPASLLAALFPLITRRWQQQPQQARRLGWQMTSLLLLLGTVAAAAGWLLAAPLIPWLYGEPFLPAAAVFQLLALSIVPAFVNYSLIHYLIARHQQGWITLLTAGMLLFHASFSWYLIPRLGVIAPAISVLLAELLLFLGCTAVLWRSDR